MSDPTVYAVASGKGGVGKTTLTINLGAALAARGRKTVVVDADLGMANLATFLDLTVDGPTLHDVLADAVTIQEATYGVEDGFAVVPGESSLERFAEAETEALGDAIADLREAFDVVLLDVGAGLSHDTVLPVGLADAVLLVATPDLAAVENAAKTKELAGRLDRDVVGIVLTRAGSQFDLDAETVESEVDVPVLAVIPEDDAVRASTHAGTPVVIADPETPASVGYSGLAAVLDGDTSMSIPVRPAFGEADEVAIETADGVPASSPESMDVGEDGDVDEVPVADEGDADDDGADGGHESSSGPDADTVAADGSTDSTDEDGTSGSEPADEDPSSTDPTSAEDDAVEGPTAEPSAEDDGGTDEMAVEPAREADHGGDRGLLKRLFDRF